jgi:hypothetical protein
MVSAICGLLVVAVAEPALGAVDTFDGVSSGSGVAQGSVGGEMMPVIVWLAVPIAAIAAVGTATIIVAWADGVQHL